MIKYLYIRFTGYCNVGCKHCYIKNTRRADFNFITREKIDYYYDMINKFQKEHKIQYDAIIRIYGGEILTVDYEILKYFFKKFDKYIIEIQTSFYHLFDKDYKERKKYYELFKKNNVIVSTSYDFFGIRTYKGSEELYEKKLLEIVKELNDYNKFPKVIITVNRLFENNENIIYNKLKKMKPYFSKIQYEIYNDYGIKNEKLSLDNKMASEILINLYKLDKKENFYVFDYFEYLTRSIKKGKREFSDYETSCQSKVLTIEENGYLGTCPKREDKFEKIENFSKIFLNPKRLEWIKFQKEKLNICLSCEFRNICNGGCPLKKKQFLNNNKDNPEYRFNCPGFYPFLKYIKDNLY